MYQLHPPAIYAHESVTADPRCRQRLERVVAALPDPPAVKVYSDGDLPAMIRGGLLAGRVPMGSRASFPDPILLFNTFRFDGRRAERIAWLEQTTGSRGYHAAEALTGYGPFCWWPVKLKTDEMIGDNVCRPCWRLHFQNGCAHKCHYCGLGGLLATMTNVEDYIERLDRLIAAHPWQETFLLEDDADNLCLEPELGVLGPLIEYFGTLAGRYLVIHTKSANVSWMLNLKHYGNTIIVWSMSGPTQSERFEPGAGSTIERIDAARAAQAAGYTIRYKFKPIIPVRPWRRDAARTIDWIFERTDPDVISMATFMWTDFGDMTRRLDSTQLDPEFLAAAERSVDAVASTRAKPFPSEVRAEIYEHHLNLIRRHDQEIPVSLSTESPEMWKLMARKLGSTVMNYVCGCGPNSTPWRKKLECDPYKAVEGGPVGGFEGM